MVYCQCREHTRQCDKLDAPPDDRTLAPSSSSLTTRVSLLHLGLAVLKNGDNSDSLRSSSGVRSGPLLGCLEVFSGLLPGAGLSSPLEGSAVWRARTKAALCCSLFPVMAAAAGLSRLSDSASKGAAPALLRARQCRADLAVTNEGASIPDKLVCSPFTVAETGLPKISAVACGVSSVPGLTR